jgi:hypothetical protein
MLGGRPVGLLFDRAAESYPAILRKKESVFSG